MNAAPRLAILLLAALLAASLLPVAAADHVYSHRLVVTGRVVGSDGMPVAGAPVTLVVHGMEVGGACLGVPDKPTTPRGDFSLCRHAHEMPRDAAILAEVEVQGATFEAPVNVFTRRAVVHAVLDEPSQWRDLGGQREMNRTVTVVGRLFLAGEDVVENMPVHATARFREAVEVRLLDAAGLVVAQRNATTGENGDFQVDLEARELPDDARVEVQYLDERQDVGLDPRLRRADVDFVVEPAAPAPPPQAEPAPTIQQPGTGDVRVPAPSAWLASAVLALAALGRGRGGAAGAGRRRR